MATFTTRAIVESLILDRGRYPGDPDVAMIVEYITPTGQTCWGVTWMTETADQQRRYLLPSTFIINPRVIWKRD